jgi:dGTPase
MLEALRFHAVESRGRRYPEAAHPYRNPFQRDRDRVIHARAFRRLEDKTQVFTPGLSDHFRNRLTHTIEVSHVARTVASVLQLNEDLTEALALAHDIGHPPFAHAGEDELNRQMQLFGDRFDHNLHALRIVETFEQRYARFPGLNLTFEVREGIVKHSRDFGPGENPQLDEYLPGLRPPLEAQLIDLADEVAYNTADLDDAMSAGLLDTAQLACSVPAVSRIFDEMETQFPGASGRERFQESLRRLVDLLVTGLIEGTAQAASESGVQTVDDVRRHPARIAAFTPEVTIVNRELKGFLQSLVYSSAALRDERRKSSAMIAELFRFFAANPDSMPVHYREQSQGEPVHRAVCDYIAGMTDGFFYRTYKSLRLGDDAR